MDGHCKLQRVAWLAYYTIYSNVPNTVGIEKIRTVGSNIAGVFHATLDGYMQWVHLVGYRLLYNFPYGSP